MKKLTPKQKAFADNYLINGYNATQAYKSAGYTVKNNAVAEASGTSVAGSLLKTNIRTTQFLHNR